MARNYSRYRLSREERQERAKALQASISSQVEEFRTTETWQEFLRFSAQFRSYSFKNRVLIYAQRPLASYVAGYRRWQELGRQVRKGEKAIKIFGYRPRDGAEDVRKLLERDLAEGKITRERYEQLMADPSSIRVPVASFPIVSVFDYSQTDPIDPANPMEPPASGILLQGDDPARIYERVSAWMTSQGWSVEKVPREGVANGWCQPDRRVIRVVDDLSAAAAAKTLIHETAHGLLHSGRGATLPRDLKELEAESVAYLVGDAFGLDTSGYSIPYLAAWGAHDTDKLAQTADRVLKAADRILEGVSPSEPGDQVDRAMTPEMAAATGVAGTRPDVQSPGDMQAAQAPARDVTVEAQTPVKPERFSRETMPGRDVPLPGGRERPEREQVSEPPGPGEDRDNSSRAGAAAATAVAAGAVVPSVLRNTPSEFDTWPEVSGDRLTGSESVVAKYSVAGRAVYALGYDRDAGRIAAWVEGTPMAKVTWMREPERITDGALMVRGRSGPVELTRDARFRLPRPLSAARQSAAAKAVAGATRETGRRLGGLS